MMRHALRWVGAVIGLAVLPVLPAYADAILTVGPGGTANGYDFATISSAVSYADSNGATYYTVEIAPATYVNDFPVVTAAMTLESSPSVTGPVILDATASPTNDKGIITTSASAVISGLTLEGAQISGALGSNAAGIRAQAGTGSLTIQNSTFANNQDGILVDGNSGETVTITGSSFISNGVGSGSYAGYEHAVYVGAVNSLAVSGSLFCGTLAGHDIKSRAASTTVTNNLLYDGAADPALNCPAGSTSYAVDLPNAGNVKLSGNQIIQGSSTGNETMVSYGEEGEVAGYVNRFLSSGDVFTNTLPGTSIGIYNHAANVAAIVNCDTFNNVSAPLVGSGSVSCTSAVSEPGSLSLLAVGLGGLAAAAGLRRRPRRRVARSA